MPAFTASTLLDILYVPPVRVSHTSFVCASGSCMYHYLVYIRSLYALQIDATGDYCNNFY